MGKKALLDFTQLQSMTQFYSLFDAFMRLPADEQLTALELESEHSILAMVSQPYSLPSNPTEFPNVARLPHCESPPSPSPSPPPSPPACADSSDDQVVIISGGVVANCAAVLVAGYCSKEIGLSTCPVTCYTNWCNG